MVMVAELVSLGKLLPVLTLSSSTLLTVCRSSFENRDVCEEVIKTFNNRTIPTATEELQVQIRYADTQEQKSLKQQTQAARQFRSAEYEYATQAYRQGRLPYAGTTLNDSASSKGNEFEQFLGHGAAVPFQNQRWAQSAVRHAAPGRSPLGAFTSNQTQVQATQDDTDSGKDADRNTREDSAVDVKPASTSPATAHANSPEATPTAAADQE